MQITLADGDWAVQLVLKNVKFDYNLYYKNDGKNFCLNIGFYLVRGLPQDVEEQEFPHQPHDPDARSPPWARKTT